MASDATSTSSNLPIPVPRGCTPSGDGVVVATGAVEVDVYVDFQSPLCRQFELMAGPTLDTLVADTIISLVYHPVNFLDAISPTGYSTRAAAAAGAASDQGMFREYTDALFLNQPPEGGPGLTDGQLVELGQDIGITEPEFAPAIRCGRYLFWPPYVTERAVQRGVGGTPSVFVRGVPVAARPGPLLVAVQGAID